MEIGLIFLSNLIIALLSLIGMFFFGDKGHVKSVHRFVVPFAMGTFLAISFFELIPAALHAHEFYGGIAIVGGFLLFYLISSILHTYHQYYDCGDPEDYCSATPVSALLVLVGDFFHNIVDGAVIASSFFVNPAVGIMTAVGVALREIPQEIAEFGVLRSAGYSSVRAATLNFLSATSVFLGAGLTVWLVTFFDGHLWLFMGVAAGSLLYVAASDLLPGVHRESRAQGTFMGTFIATLLGVVVMGALVMYANMHFTPRDSEYVRGENAHKQQLEVLYGHQEIGGEETVSY